MKLAWLTDLHLNFLNTDERQAFYNKVQAIACDAIAITGDIAEAPSLGLVLDEMAETLQKNIYFVLGNHDYFNSSVADVAADVKEHCAHNEFLCWLTHASAIKLTKDTALVGCDGWADGRCGDYQHSTVTLPDSTYIADLAQKAPLGKDALLESMQTLADNDAMQLKNSLSNVVKSDAKRVIVVTHIPPYAGACWYGKKLTDADYLPFFSSKATGDVLLAAASNNPSITFTVLCGHTHSRAECTPFPNLQVKAGAAEYYHPDVEEILQIK